MAANPERLSTSRRTRNTPVKAEKVVKKARKADTATKIVKARRAVTENPDLVTQLDEGDPIALIALLQKAGAKVSKARISTRQSTGSG